MVLAVDDGSTDDTSVHLTRAGARILHRPVNGGKGLALRAGVVEILRGEAADRAGIDYIATIDGDGQHDPADIPRMVARAREVGADLVIGGRNVDLMPPRSRFGNRFSRALCYLGTGTFVPDTQSGFRLMSVRLARSLLDEVRWRRYETEFEILLRTVTLGWTVATVEIATVYFDGNRGSHFHPFRDSLRVFGVTCRHVASRMMRGTGGRPAPTARPSAGAGTRGRSRPDERKALEDH